MPFMSYQVSVEDAVRNAGRFVQEAGADAVKLEGGERVAPRGAPHRRGRHPGDGPPRAHAAVACSPSAATGCRARGEADAERLLREARLLEEAGCFSLVLEGIPAALGAAVTARAGDPDHRHRRRARPATGRCW